MKVQDSKLIMNDKRCSIDKEDKVILNTDTVREKIEFYKNNPGAAIEINHPQRSRRVLRTPAIPKFNSIKSGKKFIKGKKLAIVTWSDVDKRTFMCWGDYWVKENLSMEFRLMNYEIVNKDEADIVIYLFGSPYSYHKGLFNPKTYNIMWLYSHPDKVTASELSNYDEIFVLSEKFVDQVDNIYIGNLNKTPMYGCTNFSEVNDIDYGQDNSIVMVANARGAYPQYGRDVIKFCTKIKKHIPYTVKIWGHKWDNYDKYDKYPKEWYVKKYFPYSELPRLYKSAKCVLIDGHEDMWHWEFVPVKLYDVFASGGLPVIKKNLGIHKIFGDKVLQYENSQDLLEIFKFISDDDNADKIKDIIDQGKRIAKEHTYKSVAERFDISINRVVNTYHNVLCDINLPVETVRTKLILNEKPIGLSHEETVIKGAKNRKGVIRV